MPDQLTEKPERKAVDLHYQRSRRSWRSRFVADYRHWVRRTFSRESYVSSLKALLWVVPLSALIWSYAFNEQLEVTNGITVNLALAQNADQVVKFSDENHVVLVKLKGPQKDIAIIEDYLRASSLKLEVDPNLGPGHHQIDVTAALTHDRRVTMAGMTVDSCVPPVVFVDVDVIVPKLVDVKLRPDEPSTLHATFTPAKVTLLGPKKEIDAFTQTYVYANPKSYSSYLDKQKLGVASVPTVALEIPAGLNAHTTPSTVSAEIQVTGDEIQVTLDAISVAKAIPEVFGSEQFRVVLPEPRITQVVIAGPKKTIQAILDKKTELPVAEFDVEFDNPTAPHTATLRYTHLAPGVRVVEDQPRTIKYTLEERK